ncbi:hypothetical protein [Vallitalea guaymasensis]|uniref:Uncharacterized protein n=1 Tax=Vallitalea guaymasensis TaxID=1185412 RepID=A0A8J8SDR6_9FIRM|nr:hypothetical protein [Vallitalea guaymasensis]QUH31102.1 hypothetical protein HYG85_20130 [Vallitalea guaymasensis]
MDDIIDEKLFYENLEQFHTEYREEILKSFKKNNKEYRMLRNEFGEVLHRLECLSEEVSKQNRILIEKFIELYSIVAVMEGSQIYLQGQIDGMRILKRLSVIKIS